MRIPDSLFKPHTLSATFRVRQDVTALRHALGRLGLNGRHVHVLHGAPGLLTLRGRRDARQWTPLTRVLNFLLNRTPSPADREETDVLQQGGWVVLIDLPRSPGGHRPVRDVIDRAGRAGVLPVDRPPSEAPRLVLAAAGVPAA